MDFLVGKVNKLKFCSKVTCCNVNLLQKFIIIKKNILDKFQFNFFDN